MQFQQDWPKDKKNYSSFNFFCGKLRKFRSTEHYGAPLEGSTISLCHSSTCHMSMESYRLAELKYAFFKRTGRKTKKLPRLKLFLWTVFKHGLLEGSIFLLQYSAVTRTPLESSLLGVKICNFTRIRHKTEEQEHSKVQKMTLHDGRTWSLYCGLVQTSYKFRQVRTGVKRYFSSTVSRTLSKFGPAPKQSCSFLTVPRSKLYNPPKLWKQRFVTLQLA